MPGREGYILLDHRDAPPEPGIPAGLLEAATLTCVHCNGVQIKNPKRVRPRGYCAKCAAYICDSCEAVAQTLGCRPFEAVVEQIMKGT